MGPWDGFAEVISWFIEIVCLDKRLCPSYHGSCSGPQHKPSQKASSDERDKGRTVIPKQRKEYRKKDPETKLVEGLIDKLKVDETGGVEDDFADMPPLEDASDHDRSSPKQGLSTPTLDSLVVMQAKDSKSNSNNFY